jgi:hypothetical protein
MDRPEKVVPAPRVLYGHVQKMVKAGLIPGKPFKCGKQIYCRFKLSAVDAFIQGANVER